MQRTASPGSQQATLPKQSWQGKTIADTQTQLNQIARGDHNAFSAVFREHQPAFVRYATGLLAGDKGAAEDVVNDAFLAIWQQAARYSASGSAQGWMRRIVRNKAIDWLRRHRNVPLADEAVTANYRCCVDDHNDPYEAVSQSFSAKRLRLSLSLLSFEQREAVWLCYFEDMAIAQIAQIADCPENTVKTRLFSARRILRESGLLESSAFA